MADRSDAARELTDNIAIAARLAGVRGELCANCPVKSGHPSRCCRRRVSRTDT